MDQCEFKYNTKEYKAWHSRKWFSKLTNEERLVRNQFRTKQRQQKKAKWVKIFGAVCYDCHNEFLDCVFEFHHLDPITKIHTDPSKVFMFSDKRIKEELDKCIMLCANCHRVRHHNDKYQAHQKRN